MGALAVLACRLEVYRAMSSKSGLYCGVAPAARDERKLKISTVSYLPVAFRRIVPIGIRTDRIVDSFLQVRLRGEGVFNGGDNGVGNMAAVRSG